MPGLADTTIRLLGQDPLAGRLPNLGGLTGADRHCQSLAAAVGAGSRTWHAYLSTQASGNQPAVNARDRIGTGPWVNANGVLIGTATRNSSSGKLFVPNMTPPTHHELLIGTARELTKQGLDLVPPTKRESFELMSVIRNRYAAHREPGSDHDHPAPPRRLPAWLHPESTARP